MASITFKGSTVNTSGTLPEIGSKAADFKITKTDLSDTSLADYKGKKVVLNIFPSVDTGICAASVRAFNTKASNQENTVVLCISKDLPFAHTRFCEAEGLKNVIPASQYKNNSFEEAYHITMTDGPLAGLFSRAVIILDEEGTVVYTEQVPEIVQEPDYDKAVAAIS